MIGELSPGLILIVGALLVPFLRGFLRAVLMLVLPAIALWQLVQLWQVATPDNNVFGSVQLFDLTLQLVRLDGLSFVFALIFIFAAFLSVVYALHVRDTVQDVAGLVYAGSAIGAVLAGDLVTLFLYWEGTAIASVFLIWANRTERSYAAGMRYLVIHIGSGVLLLAGVLIHYHATQSIGFGKLGLDAPGGWLIFLAFAIKCAFPFLHNWLTDAYPEATVTGTVMLSAFSTKLAVYALARGYAGTEILVPIGAAMTVFPIFYALIENDLRRVLSYSLINQLGFMVVGIGIGTDLALSGTAAHAFCHVLYKSLLFMSMGAVLYRVGTIKGSELGGLYKSMPWTMVFCCVGAASISAFPLFSGFISKSLIISAAMKEGYFWTWLTLLFASACVLHYSGIKIPYFAFFARDSGKRCEEAPANMLLAMGITAALCIAIGVFPHYLYAILPHDVTYHAYTLEHIVTQLQLLMFSALAFTILIRTGIYPPKLRSTNLDTDWLYRRAGFAVVKGLETARQAIWAGICSWTASVARGIASLLHLHHAPDGALGRTWATGTMAFWTTTMLLAYLVVSMLL